MTGAVLLFGFYSCYSLSTAFDKKPEVRPNGPATPATPRQMFADYDANQLRAEEKYKGKLVLISGRVMSVGKDVTDTPYVIIVERAGDQLGVQCLLDTGEGSRAALLNVGDPVRAEAVVSSPLGHIQARQCQLR